METRDIASARGNARAVIQRIVQDPGFADQLRADPRSTLLAGGFPNWAIDDFLTHDLGIEPEVAGYALHNCSVTTLLGIDEDGSNLN
jgi:hypothetical protein